MQVNGIYAVLCICFVTIRRRLFLVASSSRPGFAEVGVCVGMYTGVETSLVADRVLAGCHSVLRVCNRPS